MTQRAPVVIGFRHVDFGVAKTDIAVMRGVGSTTRTFPIAHEVIELQLHTTSEKESPIMECGRAGFETAGHINGSRAVPRLL